MAPQPSKSTMFYMHPRALTFEFNALGDPDNLSVSVYANAKIQAYVKDIDEQDSLGITPSNEYREWTISAYPTHFTDDAGCARYAHVALSRNGGNAVVVFPDTLLDIYGRPVSDDGKYFLDDAGQPIVPPEPDPDADGDGQQPEADDTGDPSKDGDWFFMFIGRITSSDGGTARRGWDGRFPVTGMLDTARYWEEEQKGEWAKMFTLNEVFGYIEQHYPIRISRIFSLALGKGGKLINDILRKQDIDEEADGDADGTQQPPSVEDPDAEQVNEDEILPTVAAMRQLALSRTQDDTADGNIRFKQKVGSDHFTTGFVGGAGWDIDHDGNGEMESLRLRSFLEVPEMRFNRVDVVSGELWNSIAFGLIESVTIDDDGRGGVATLHLEEGERSGLHENDICRGIFSSFGDGSAKSDAVDANGFQQLYGFWTAYFTPVAIITNEEGSFSFRYALQPGTTVHPCAQMKFAVYGSFTDASRRASAYATRTYKRYLKGVDKWQIDPTENIASQFGNLDGLTIGGRELSGEGTYLSNIFMTGAFIQFTPDQREEMFGKDAYNVVLSSYEAILHLDADGEEVGLEIERNVVIDDDNNVTATADGEEVNVADTTTAISTTIQAYKGAVPLVHTEQVQELGFIVLPTFINCTGFVLNGVLSITSVINKDENAMVQLVVNCEGKATFKKEFTISVVRDPVPAIVADLDNEMDTVVEHATTGQIIGSPITTTGRMYYGSDVMELAGMSVYGHLPEGIGCDIQTNDDNSATATITVGTDAAESSQVEFELRGRREGGTTLYVKHARFLVNKITALYQLRLMPAVAEVKVGEDGTFNGSASRNVACQVLITDASHAFVPATYASVLEHKARIFYEVDSSADVPSFRYELDEDTYANGIAVTSDNDSVTFWIYYYPDGLDVAGSYVKFDMETIHVLYDAAESFVSLVFKRSNELSVDAPSADEGSYKNPVPAGWSDGIPAGTERVWMSRRRFTSNGQHQDAAWTEPRPITDTADFDVCFHDALPDGSQPAPPAATCHPTQGPGYAGSNGWYNEGSTASEWMATSTCSNGAWSAWSVVRIKGEDGKSAYDVAVQNGFEGTEEEWLESLHGAAVSEVLEWYATNDDDDDYPPLNSSSWKHTIDQPTRSNRYIWNYEETKDSNGKIIAKTTPVIVARYTEDGKGIDHIVEEYALSQDADTVPTAWSTTVPKMDESNRYLWNRETIYWTDGTVGDPTPPAIIGVHGKSGKDGNDGKAGKVVRTRGEWSEFDTYCGSADDSPYIDVVFVQSGGHTTYYQAVSPQKGVAPRDTYDGDREWESSSFKFVATQVLFAERSFIENLWLNHAEAGYYNSDGEWVPTLSFDGNGVITIDSGTRDAMGTSYSVGTMTDEGWQVTYYGRRYNSVSTYGSEINMVQRAGSTTYIANLNNAMLTLSVSESNGNNSVVITPSGLEYSEGSSSKTISWSSLFDLIQNGSGLNLVECTQAEYDAMPSHDSSTLYVIKYS